MPTREELVAQYREQAAAAMAEEVAKRQAERGETPEDARLKAASLVEMAGRIRPGKGLGMASEQADPRQQLGRALLVRLGAVREALDGHGGGVLVKAAVAADDDERAAAGTRIPPLRDGALSLVLELDGACLSCGAVPSTLQGIVDDLSRDPEVARVRFTSATRDLFSDIGREYLERFGSVEFTEA